MKQYIVLMLFASTILAQVVLPTGTDNCVISWSKVDQRHVGALIYVKAEGETAYKYYHVDGDAGERFTYTSKGIPFEVFIQNTWGGLRSAPSETLQVSFGEGYIPPPVVVDTSEFVPLPDFWSGPEIYSGMDRRNGVTYLGGELIMPELSYVFTMFEPVAGHQHQILIYGEGSFSLFIGTTKEMVVHKQGGRKDFNNEFNYLYTFSVSPQWVALFAVEDSKVFEFYILNLSVELERPINIEVSGE